jgi:DNA invertase Pin-like site-specific DNA recombinase
VYVDHGPTGTNRDRPGLREALAACREGDTLVVTKLDRLARSLPDARAIADDLDGWPGGHVVTESGTASR